MIVKLSEIDDTLTVKGTMEDTQHTLVEKGGFTLFSPVAYELTVRKIEAGASIKGTISCVLALLCARCLEEFSLPVSARLDIELIAKTSMSGDSELELTGDEMDVSYFEGDEIDLSSLVYEELLLNIPMRPLCTEDCRGLCGSCGKNRNYEVCFCDSAPQMLLGEKLKSFLN
jgi:uncharacterized protein